MKRHHFIILWVLLLSVLITTITIIIFLVTRTNDLREAIRQSVQDEIKHLQVPQSTPGKDGYTPIKNIDYFDGQDGKNGKDGTSVTTDQVKKAVSDYFAANPVINGTDGKDGASGADGVSGATPIIRCNKDKNRWEVKYHEEDAWQLLNNEKVPCTTEAQ